MNQRPVPSKLVNFRMPKALLEPFDDICFLSGKTRTQVLAGLIKAYVSDVGTTITGEMNEARQTNEALRNSVLCMSKPKFG
jgi:hypothetical protein